MCSCLCIAALASRHEKPLQRQRFVAKVRPNAVRSNLPCGVSGLALNPAGKTLAEACEDNSLRRSSAAMQEHIFALRRLPLHFVVVKNLFVGFLTSNRIV